LTRRDVVDRFQPQERAVLLQSMALNQACRPIASTCPDGCSTPRPSNSAPPVLPFETEGLIDARTARAFDL